MSARWLGGGGLCCCFPICFPFLSLSTGDACHGRLVQNLGKMWTSFTAKHFISHIYLKLRFVLLCHFMLSFPELNFVVRLSSLTAETCWLSLKQFDDFRCTSPRLGCCKRAADGMTSPPSRPSRASTMCFQDSCKVVWKYFLCEIWVLLLSGLQVVDVCRKFKVLSGGNFHVLHCNRDLNMAL